MIWFIRRVIQKLSRDYEIGFFIKKDMVPNSSYFEDVYNKRLFGRSESASGPGSSILATKAILIRLPKILDDFGIKSIADVPCGDLNWIQKLNLKDFQYSGYDIVPDLIKTLRAKFENHNFEVFDVVKDVLPKKDLIMCRDLLVHLTLEQSVAAVSNFKGSGSTYLLATTFTGIERNRELVVPKIGVAWRPLNLEKPPFNLGEPIILLNENSKEGRGKYSDKCLGLWRIN